MLDSQMNTIHENKFQELNSFFDATDPETICAFFKSMILNFDVYCYFQNTFTAKQTPATFGKQVFMSVGCLVQGLDNKEIMKSAESREKIVSILFRIVNELEAQFGDLIGDIKEEISTHTVLESVLFRFLGDSWSQVRKQTVHNVELLLQRSVDQPQHCHKFLFSCFRQLHSCAAANTDWRLLESLLSLLSKEICWIILLNNENSEEEQRQDLVLQMFPILSHSHVVVRQNAVSAMMNCSRSKCQNDKKICRIELLAFSYMEWQRLDQEEGQISAMTAEGLLSLMTAIVGEMNWEERKQYFRGSHFDERCVDLASVCLQARGHSASSVRQAAAALCTSVLLDMTRQKSDSSRGLLSHVVLGSDPRARWDHNPGLLTDQAEVMFAFIDEMLMLHVPTWECLEGSLMLVDSLLKEVLIYVLLQLSWVTSTSHNVVSNTELAELVLCRSWGNLCSVTATALSHSQFEVDPLLHENFSQDFSDVFPPKVTRMGEIMVPTLASLAVGLSNSEFFLSSLLTDVLLRTGDEFSISFLKQCVIFGQRCDEAIPSQHHHHRWAAAHDRAVSDNEAIQASFHTLHWLGNHHPQTLETRSNLIENALIGSSSSSSRPPTPPQSSTTNFSNFFTDPSPTPLSLIAWKGLSSCPREGDGTERAVNRIESLVEALAVALAFYSKKFTEEGKAKFIEPALCVLVLLLTALLQLCAAGCALPDKGDSIRETLSKLRSSLLVGARAISGEALASMPMGGPVGGIAAIKLLLFHTSSSSSTSSNMIWTRSFRHLARRICPYLIDLCLTSQRLPFNTPCIELLSYILLYWSSDILNKSPQHGCYEWVEDQRETDVLLLRLSEAQVYLLLSSTPSQSLNNRYLSDLLLQHSSQHTTIQQGDLVSTDLVFQSTKSKWALFILKTSIQMLRQLEQHVSVRYCLMMVCLVFERIDVSEDDDEEEVVAMLRVLLQELFQCIMALFDDQSDAFFVALSQVTALVLSCPEQLKVEIENAEVVAPKEEVTTEEFGHAQEEDSDWDEDSENSDWDDRVDQPGVGGSEVRHSLLVQAVAALAVTLCRTSLSKTRSLMEKVLGHGLQTKESLFFSDLQKQVMLCEHPL